MGLSLGYGLNVRPGEAPAHGPEFTASLYGSSLGARLAARWLVPAQFEIEETLVELIGTRLRISLAYIQELGSAWALAPAVGGGVDVVSWRVVSTPLTDANDEVDFRPFIMTTLTLKKKMGDWALGVQAVLDVSLAGTRYTLLGSVFLLSACTDVNRLGTEDTVDASGGASAGYSKKTNTKVSEAPKTSGAGGSRARVKNSSPLNKVVSKDSQPDAGGPGGASGGDQEEGVFDFSQCEVSESELESGHCNYQFECEDGTYWNGCEEEDGVAICYCGSPHAYITLVVEESNASEVCPQLVDLCTGAEVKQREEVDCGTVEQTEETNSCFLSMECESPHNVASALDVDSRYNDSAGCEKKGDVWECGCFLHLERAIWFDLEGTAVENSSCNTAMDFCQSAPALEEGPRSCCSTEVSASPERCETEVLCEGNAWIGDTPATTADLNLAVCNEDAGSWNCDCAGKGSGPPTFEIDATDSTSACAAASDVCAQGMLTEAP